jgi:hypothetical protein
MEETGINCPLSFFTFKYSGREPKSIASFLSSRPDIKNYYIYDLLLSSGSLLYSCMGGIGVTKEKYLVDMHQALKLSTFSTAIKEKLQSQFKNGFTRPAYFRLREKFNKKNYKTKNLNDCAELYCLWICSNFAHRYKLHAYDGVYLPIMPDLQEIKNSSIISKDKKLLFRKEDLYSFSESLVGDNVIIYMHLPDTFGKYGAGFYWSLNGLKETASIINELSSMGYKVCISARARKLGSPAIDYKELFPLLRVILVEEFKVSKLNSRAVESDIYLLNF